MFAMAAESALACLRTPVKVFVRRSGAAEASAAALYVTMGLSVAEATALAIAKLRITTAAGNRLPTDCAVLKLAGSAEPLPPVRGAGQTAQPLPPLPHSIPLTPSHSPITCPSTRRCCCATWA